MSWDPLARRKAGLVLNPMRVSDFDYELPKHLIAQEPAPERDKSRLLVIDRASGRLTDSVFERLPEFLQSGDLLVVNNTRVFPARLIGRRLRQTPRGRTVPGGRVEIFLLKQIELLVWEALVRPGRALLPGARVEFIRDKFYAEVIEWLPSGRRIVKFEAVGDFDQLVDRIGHTPLPPYIKRDQEDRLDAERYQTVYARERGSIAAPTAGLHFTLELLERLRQSDIQIVEIALHVGYGTFQPVRVQQVEEHHIEPESYTISREAADSINRALKEGRRVIAVGTTTTRALESAALQSQEKRIPPISHGITDLFIYPGFEFKVISGLITNFHLPRSSLLMLVSAFAGRELILTAYRHAIQQQYRFYSYGDATLIL